VHKSLQSPGSTSRAQVMSHAQPSSGDTLVAAAVKILLQPEPIIKSAWSHQVAQLWRTGDICDVADGSERRPPDTPARPQSVQLVERWNVPKLGRGGTASSRQARTVPAPSRLGISVFGEPSTVELIRKALSATVKPSATVFLCLLKCESNLIGSSARYRPCCTA
jgi:hypothetical protein